MKISVNDVELFTISPVQEQVIKNNIASSSLGNDLGRRLQWIMMQKYEQCFNELKNEWDAKLAANGITMIPIDKDEYASLVFSQPNYKDRAARDLELLS